MILSDKEILELNELCGAWVDGTATEAQRRRLEDILRTSEAARRYYVRAMGLSASLCHYAGDMQCEAPDAARPRAGSRRAAIIWLSGLGLAAAAGIAAVLWLHSPSLGAVEDRAPDGGDYVAQLTGANSAQGLSTAGGALRLGDHLRRGQRLELASGFAEVTFDSGAEVVLHGPAALDVNSPWDGTLRRGALRAFVPPEAVGFRIASSSVEVVDLGTEFSMMANSSGSADVLVLKGEVEAAPRSAGEQDSILMRANDARQFAGSGISAVPGGTGAFAAITQKISFDRFSPAMHYLHWTFDTMDGNVLPAESIGLGQGGYGLQLADVADDAQTLAPFRGGRRALRLDGHLYGRAHVPGLSSNVPRTVAFWVKVPADAPLMENYAMVAWGATGRKMGSHPVHITWNRTPGEGPVGALRTDFGGGSAMGTTSLRDGRWHHVAVVFAPGDSGSPVQVIQYVDGKLESSSINPPRRTLPPVGSSKVETRMDLTDNLWVGCRLGTNGLKNERFVGEIAELFVANWQLEPAKIVQVMREDRIPGPGAALALR